MNIVSVQFQSKSAPGKFAGREYSYYSKVPLEVGDIILAPAKNGATPVRVCRVDIPESEINDNVRPFTRTIEEKVVPESNEALK